MENDEPLKLPEEVNHVNVLLPFKPREQYRSNSKQVQLYSRKDWCFEFDIFLNKLKSSSLKVPKTPPTGTVHNEDAVLLDVIIQNLEEDRLKVREEIERMVQEVNRRKLEEKKDLQDHYLYDPSYILYDVLEHSFEADQFLLRLHRNKLATPSQNSIEEAEGEEPREEEKGGRRVGQISDESFICQICNGSDVYDTNNIVFCSKCSITVHQMCYRLQKIPATDWICRLCEAFGEAGKYMPCIFCTKVAGAMNPTNLSASNSLVALMNPPLYRRNSKTGASTSIKNSQLPDEHSAASNQVPEEPPQKTAEVTESETRKHSEFYKNLHYNYFNLPASSDHDTLKSLQPLPKTVWCHLSCSYWIPQLTFDSKTHQVQGIENVDKRRLNVKCGICKQTRGCVVQCVAKNCFKSYHVECARKSGIFLGYGYRKAPYWRLRCPLHQELEIYKKMKFEESKYEKKMVKYMKIIKQEIDLHASKTYQPQAPPHSSQLKQTDTPPLIIIDINKTVKEDGTEDYQVQAIRHKKRRSRGILPKRKPQILSIEESINTSL